jgi:hypothetical protein
VPREWFGFTQCAPRSGKKLALQDRARESPGGRFARFRSESSAQNASAERNPKKNFWQGESMVDERIIAILPRRESIIDALLMCLCESAAVAHVILISSAFFDSHGGAVWCARGSDK